MKVNTLYEKFFEYSVKLEEKTFNIKNDVDKIYDLSGFDTIVERFSESKLSSLSKDFIHQIEIGKSILLHTTDTSILEEEDSRKAHAINPVPIYIGVFKKTYYSYDPKTKAKRLVISLNKAALMYAIRNKNIPKEQLRFKLNKSRYNSLQNELSENGIKTAIAHELSHWIQDSVHNYYLSNMMQKAHDLDDNDIMLLKQKTINMTHFELDAQIHAIKDLKDRVGDEWETLSLNDLFSMYSSLHAIAVEVYGKEKDEKSLYIWVKYLVKRMSREGILGKNMRKYPTIDELFGKDWMSV